MYQHIILTQKMTNTFSGRFSSNKTTPEIIYGRLKTEVKLTYVSHEAIINILMNTYLANIKSGIRNINIEPTSQKQPKCTCQNE